MSYNIIFSNLKQIKISLGWGFHPLSPAYCSLPVDYTCVHITGALTTLTTELPRCHAHSCESGMALKKYGYRSCVIVVDDH